MKLAIQLVTWNGSKYIEQLFESLKKQTFTDFKLVILDNASSDDTVLKIKKELENFPFEHELIINSENKGFAGGHNQLFSEIRTQIAEFILLLNQDMYLMPDCIEKLIHFMNDHLDVATISPRLMKWDFSSLPLTKREIQREFAGDFGTASATLPTLSWKERDIKKSFTNQIDSLGLKIFRNRRVIEKYAGKIWEEVKPKMLMSVRAEKIVGDGVAMEVFGVSGALPMYRRSVIDVVGLFDESFGSYKEDVDLAYRLRSAGYKAYTILDAVAYHDRSAVGLEQKGDLVAVENKRKQSEWVKYNSYKNHLITLIKNEYWQNYLLDLPWIKWYELKKFVYFLLFGRPVLRGLREILKMRKDLKNKRLEIIQKRKIGWREMRRWWG